ncbi:pyruvate dehydrogenase complex dihydrolipoamide acetyltransferase [Sphingorhabdus lutea]|uniref:Acetyltransferase component of pyruvate dehydrogenase complex n=1 Tax=Sphingorhabdus lutea TaxID=1913578 RepID=A0A1L3JC04_9SPHN|nr:pyruvate dehydrogenase complex dihydrolipoamide acetyltransferase [Sphingorhabdus lutea]APG62677.1 pyruvate dehydrogenase complex dihydrolipoamide acetyltransferase [Sphingorhabdus lutea]
MAVELKMPALSPTMEEGTLARWLVKEGDNVSSGDLLAEIETDKATMEFEAIDDGVIAKILVAEGTDNVKVGDIIAIIAEEGEDASSIDSAPVETAAKQEPAKVSAAQPAESAAASPAPSPTATPVAAAKNGSRIKASPLARRLAENKGVDLASLSGTGPGGRIVKVDVEGASVAPANSASATATSSASAGASPAISAPAPVVADDNIPHSVEKLTNMRKTIARRLTESKQQVPHIYLTVDIQLDKLLKLRSELNAALEPQGVKLSVNDLLIKALAKSLIAVPKCNVSFAGDSLISYSRADISVAVSIPAGLITPIIQGADTKSISAISTEIKELAARAKEGKLQPHEFQGGTASLSNMGMFGIKQFEAVINPPQAMIMAIGAGEQRPYIVDGALSVATVMSATGSFDHRAIDGADGAQLMKVFKSLVENPLGMLA